MTQTFQTPEEALEHFGVRGMKWGVRRSSPSGPVDNSRRNKALKIGAGVAVVTGLGVAGVLLAKHGSRPSASVMSSASKAKFDLNTDKWFKEAFASTQRGQSAAKKMPTKTPYSKLVKTTSEYRKLAESDTRSWYNDYAKNASSAFPAMSFADYSKHIMG